MSRAATLPAFALALVVGFPGCNKGEQGARGLPASQENAGAEERRPAPGGTAPEKPGKVTLLRVPNGGIQPQAAVDARGTLHLIYFKGKAGAGDLFYVGRRAGEKRFSDPVRVNSRPGSAIATGTIRGGQL